MPLAATEPRLVLRTATIRLWATRRQTARCHGLLRSAGDVWVWLLDSNRKRVRQGDPPVTSYQARCHELTRTESFGELSVVGARSVLQRYSDAWFQAAKRRRNGQHAGFPRRKRALVPVRFCDARFRVEGRRVRLPVAEGQPELWVRLARPLPYPSERVRAVTLLADGGRLWLAVTAAVPVQDHDLDPDRLAGMDLGVIHPYGIVEAAKQVVAFAVQQKVGTLVAGDPTGITDRDVGRVQNLRRRRWRRIHLMQALQDKAEQAGIVVRLVDERGTSSTCPACRQRVPKPKDRRFFCPHCTFHGHRDLVGARNIAARTGGGPTGTSLPVLVEHRRAGIVPARRDRRRHLHDQRRRRSCLASGHPPDDPASRGCRSPRVPDLAPGEDQAVPPNRAHVA